MRVVHRLEETRSVIHRCAGGASDSGARPQCGDVDASAYAAVLTADEELLDRLLATMAAVGMEPRVLSDPGALRAVWRDATAVAVGCAGGV